MSAAIDSSDGVSLLWLLAAAAQPLLARCNPYALLHTKPWKIDYAFHEQDRMIDAFHVRRTCIHTSPMKCVVTYRCM